MTMKKKAGRASRADVSNVIGLAVAQAKGRVQQLDTDGIANVSGGFGGFDTGSGREGEGGIGGLSGGPGSTAGMVDTDPGGSLPTLFGGTAKLD